MTRLIRINDNVKKITISAIDLIKYYQYVEFMQIINKNRKVKTC